MLLLLSVAFIISTRLASLEVAKALELLTYSAFLITIPILVLYVIARVLLKTHTNEGGESAEG